MRKLILLLALALLLCGCVDGVTKIGLDRLNWSQSIDGIKFSGTAPASPTGVLYNDSGELKFNGSNISRMDCDVLIKLESDGIYAYASSGSVLASDVSSPFDFGAVFNAVMTNNGPGQTIAIDGDFDYTTSSILLNHTEVYGVGSSSLSTADDVSAFTTANDTYIREHITIEHLNIFYTDTSYCAVPQIAIYNPLSCTLKDLKVLCTSVSSYSASHSGGIYLYGYHDYTWLNKIEDCTVSRLALLKITDSTIKNVASNTYGKGSHAIKLNGACNNVKIVGCEIVCDTNAGIYISHECWHLQIKDNYFEAHMHTPTPGNVETGIHFATANKYAEIEGNHFSYINGYGIYYVGNCGVIANNIFENCNVGDNSYDDIAITSGDTNMIHGNIGTRAYGETNKGYLADDTNYNIFYNNHAKGDLYLGCVDAGANSLNQDNVAWPGTP